MQDLFSTPSHMDSDSEGAMQCPRCNAWIDRTDKPFCVACGWNLDKARGYFHSQGFRLQKLLGLLAFVFFLYFLFDIPISLLVLFAAAGSYFFIQNSRSMWRKTQELKQRPGEQKSLLPASVQAQRANELCVSLSALRKPRRLAFADWSIALTGAIAVLFLLILLSQPRPRAKGEIEEWLLFAVGTVVLGSAAWQGIRRAWKEYRVLAFGEIALGQVKTHIPRRRKGRLWGELYYEFHDLQGSFFTGVAEDDTCEYFEEMHIPVFYDPANPHRNAAHGCTCLRLADFR